MRGPHRIVADCKTDAAAMTGIWPSFAGFAWPWLLLALPLPWLLRRLLPPVRSASAALKVPYGARLDAIAGARGLARGGRASWWLWLAWPLLCVAAARPQPRGEAVQPPQAGRALMPESGGAAGRDSGCEYGSVSGGAGRLKH